jgi:hypothetical protein
MKNISAFKASKYSTKDYELLEDDIYRCGGVCVITLQFQQEPEMDEGSSSADISQYPLEDILDRFNVHISDFYDSENKCAKVNCRLEFASRKIENIRNLKSIIGKRVYNKVVTKNGDDFVELVIE